MDLESIFHNFIFCRGDSLVGRPVITVTGSNPPSSSSGGIQQHPRGQHHPQRRPPQDTDPPDDGGHGGKVVLPDEITRELHELTKVINAPATSLNLLSCC